MDEQEQQRDNHEEKKSSWSPVRVVGLLLVVITTMVIVYAVVGYTAWQSGQIIREDREEKKMAEQLVRQVTLAEEDINRGSYNLALRRLEWVLERDPANENAQEGKQQVEAALNIALTPEIQATEPPLLEPSPTPGKIDEPAAEYQRLSRLDQQERWEDLLPATLAFQRQFPDYERLTTDGFLYDSFLNLGLEYIQGDQIEVGISHFAQAEKLGNLPQEALDYWLWAELHLQGMAYYGVNWGAAISYFRDLCLSAPFYQGSCENLYDSLTGYGDQYMFAQDYCPAANLFREARQQNRSSALDEKLSEAVQGCNLATPTPASITNTLPVNGTGLLDPPSSNE